MRRASAVQLDERAAESLSGIGASATPTSLTGSASGSVNYLINLVDAGEPKK